MAGGGEAHQLTLSQPGKADSTHQILFAQKDLHTFRHSCLSLSFSFNFVPSFGLFDMSVMNSGGNIDKAL